MNNDINFFQTYEGIKQEKNFKKKYSLVVGIILLVIIGGSLTYNSISIFVFNREINNFNEKLNSAELIEELSKAELLENKIEILANYDDEISGLLADVSTRDRISKNLLDMLSSTVPSEVSFNSLSISNNEILINAESSSRTAIAELTHNLRALTNIEDVYIGSILENDSYSFNIKCTLKDVE